MDAVKVAQGLMLKARVNGEEAEQCDCKTHVLPNLCCKRCPGREMRCPFPPDFPRRGLTEQALMNGCC